MNAHTPFDAKQDWTNPYCQNSSNDPMVDALLGNAYHVVRTVYCNLGNLKPIYDFLNKYGMVLGVQSETELKAMNTSASYVRLYGFDNTNKRVVTDYLYVEGDRTGVIPDDPTATGSWILVATSNSDSGGDDGDGKASPTYIPYSYNNGSAIGGETTIPVPAGTVGVPMIVIDGYTNLVGYGFTYDAPSLTVTLAQPLEPGDEVHLFLTGTPAVPDNPNVSDWVQINWLYNGGYASGGEQVIAIPYTFESVPAIYKNGERYYAGLVDKSYTVDAANQRILLTEPLATNDRLIVQIGGESTTLIMSDRTIQEVARSANVHENDVILSTNTTQYLNGKKVVYDVVAQKIYGLPTLPTNVYINSVSNGQLTYSPGSVTVDLTPVPGSAELLKEELASSTGTSLVGYTTTNGVATTLENKLKYDVRSLYDYGFRVGNTGAQNKAALQAAIDDADLAVELVIPRGTYICDPGVVIGNSNIIRIRGAGMYQSVIFTAGEAESLITQGPTAIAFYEFIDFGLNGNYKANTLLNLTEAHHCKIIRVQFMNTIGNALICNGYSNDIVGCRIMENHGNAISLGGVCNNLNITQNRIYGNNGAGVVIQPEYAEGGMSILLEGNDIEMNKTTGVLSYGVKGLNIIGNYFERNGEVGMAYSDVGGVTVKADINLIANFWSITPVADKANDTVVIMGNQQTSFGYANDLGAQDGFIFTNFAKNLKVHNNQMLSPGLNRGLICMHNSNYVTKVDGLIDIAGNSKNNISIIGSAADDYDNINWGHLVDNKNIDRPINLLEKSMLSWTRFSGTTGLFIKTTNKLGTDYSFAVTDGDSEWITTIDLSQHPDLKDKYIWFGAWVNDQGGAAKLIFGINGKYSSNTTPPSSGTGTWKFVSACVYIGPGDTVIRASITKVGTGTVIINSPVIAEIGAAYNRVPRKELPFMAAAAPTTGLWEVGERVINTNVASGSPVAWTCAVAGATFLVESNYL